MPDPQLTTLAKHCRAMAEPGAHVEGCESLKPPTAAAVRNWFQAGAQETIQPRCDGCVPEHERRLWRQIGDELTAYLAGDLTQTDDPDQLTLEPKETR